MAELDGNIFFRGLQAQQNNQQSFFNNISRGIANYQHGKDRELRKQQIEASQAEKASDPKRMAQEYMIEGLMAKGMSRGEAAARVYSASKEAVNPYTGQSTPNMMDQLGLGSLAPRGGGYTGTFTGQPMNTGPDITGVSKNIDPVVYGAQGQGSNPAMQGMSYDEITPIIDNTQMEGFISNAAVEGMDGVVPGAPGMSMEPQSDMSRMYGQAPTPERLAQRPQYSPNMPGPMKSATEAQIGLDAALDQKAGEKQIDLAYTPAEMELKNRYELEKVEAATGIAFDDYLRRQKADQVMAKEASLPQEALKIQSSFQEAENMNATIKDIYDNAGSFTTGWLGNLTKEIAGSPAHDLAANLKTIESDAGLSKLIEVKERGGTFGALQEKELDLLIANRSALLQSQSPGQFKENLIKYQTQRNKTMSVISDFYKEKYGELPEGLEGALSKNVIDPMVEKAKSGQVFVNPQTKERIQYKDGQWTKI